MFVCSTLNFSFQKQFFSLLGEIPYPGEQWSFDSYRMLQDGHRMAMPKYANDNMYGTFMSFLRIKYF